MTFGRLRVLERAENSNGGSARWLCECVCGETPKVLGCSLRMGTSQSCGCLQRELAAKLRMTHGKGSPDPARRARSYKVWMSMNSRCRYPSSPGWKHYGGRGIQVCDRWGDFRNFLSDMGEPPPGTQIERKDNNGDYEPGNCVWATRHVQNRNRRDNVFVIVAGERMVMKDACAKYGIHDSTVYRTAARHKRPATIVFAEYLARSFEPDQMPGVEAA